MTKECAKQRRLDPTGHANRGELTEQELSEVTGGADKAKGTTSGTTFLRFDFALVAVKTISW